MSFPRHSEYKRTNKSWFNEIPSHWEIAQIKWLSPVKRGASPRPIDDPVYFDDDGEYGWVRISDVTSSKGLLLKTEQQLSELGSSLSVKLEPGQLFLSIAGSVGKSCFSGIKCCIHDGFVYFPELSINPRFLQRIFESGKCFGGLGKLGTQLNLNTDTVGSIFIPFPSCTIETEQIISFLDRETAKIDALIDEQERLIELFQEKRKAIISHAVTKGLNPSAPMKDSGVEWLGEVPEHWGISPLNYVLKAVGDVDHYMPESTDSGVPYVMTGDLKDLASNIDFEACKQVSEEDYEKLTKKIKTQKGDLILARYATIGTVSYVDTDIKLLVSYSCVTIKVNPVKIASKYLYFFIKSQAFESGVKSKVNSNTQDNVGIGDLKKVLIVLPKAEEQLAIVEHLLSATSQLDNQMQISERAVGLLKERRSALISAAVTGQIDLRGIVQEEGAAV